MSGQREGGCLCGAVRYAVAWPPAAVVVCHCRNCQKQAGSALSVVGVSPRDALMLTGELAIYEDRGESGQTVWRKFCPKCGSPVLTDTPAAQRDGLIFFKAGTLDETADLRPSLHYFRRSAQGWFPFPADADCLDTQ